MAEDAGANPVAAGTLLLVDDEENILSALRRLLRRDGYQIHVAHSGEEALTLLAHTPVDVIISDQRMPGMNGTEFLRQARGICPETVRIVLSGYTELGSVTAAINDGAVYKFLTKPWDDELLRANVAEAFRIKRMRDDNQRLSTELTQSNVRLNALLEERQRRILVGEASLYFAHEAFHALPVPVLGVDIDGVLVLANAEAESLFARGLIGMQVGEVLPAALCALLAAPLPSRVAHLPLGGRNYRVITQPIHRGGALSGTLCTLIGDGDD